MITWSEIQAEADASGYKERLVAVFRKYEGQLTDEKDEQGRTVKVTAASFARHMGIPESTFKGWTTARVVLPEHREQMEEARARRVAREIAQRPSEERKEFIKDIANTLTNEEREDLAFDITSEASRERQQNYARQAKENQSRQQPSELEIVHALSQANRNLEQAIQYLKNRKKLSDEALEVCKGDIAAAREKLNQIETALGNPSVEDELRQILEAGR